MITFYFLENNLIFRLYYESISSYLHFSLNSKYAIYVLFYLKATQLKVWRPFVSNSEPMTKAYLSNDIPIRRWCGWCHPLCNTISQTAVSLLPMTGQSLNLNDLNTGRDFRSSYISIITFTKLFKIDLRLRKEKSPQEIIHEERITPEMYIKGTVL